MKSIYSFLLAIGLLLSPKSDSCAQHGHGEHAHPFDYATAEGIWNDSTLEVQVRISKYSDYLKNVVFGMNPDSIFVYGSRLSSLSRLNGLKKGEAYGNRFMAYASDRRGEGLLALSYLEKALLIFEEIDDEKDYIEVQSNIGMSRYSLGEYDEAQIILENCLPRFEKIGDSLRWVKVMSVLSSNYLKQGKPEQSLSLMTKALEVYLAMDNKIELPEAYHNLGTIMAGNNRMEEAVSFHQKGLDALKNHPDLSAEAHISQGMGMVYIKMGEYSKAIEWCEKSLDIGERIHSNLWKLVSCECLYEAHKGKGDGASAFVYSERVKELNVAMEVDARKKKLQQIEFAKIRRNDSLEQVAKEMEMSSLHDEELEKKNDVRNILGVLGLLLIILALSLYIRNKVIRKAKLVVEDERDKSDNLLLNILPEEIAKELKEKGEAAARDFEMVSIIFTDFKQFTQMSEKLKATELVAEINHCFKEFDNICEKFGVEKIKTIGDAYMAAGGLPVPSEDSVKNTVLAAIEMQSFVVARHKLQVARGLPAFEMRVGLHTGPVVAGIVGVKKFQYDVWGDTVNTASRMESSGEVGKVNVSQATYELIKHELGFEFESRGKIEAKGKGEVEMFFVSTTEALA